MVRNHDRRSNHVDTVHECDGQTDTQTDRRTDRITMTKTVRRIASHGKNYKSQRITGHGNIQPHDEKRNRLSWFGYVEDKDNAGWVNRCTTINCD